VGAAASSWGAWGLFGLAFAGVGAARRRRSLRAT